MKKSVIALSAALAALVSTACATDQAKTPGADAPELANYARTGTYETCLTNHRIRQIRILNRHQILVEMDNQEAYLAEPQHCPSLSKGLALVYDASLDSLCNTTIIRLVDPGAPPIQRGSCGIDRFEKLEKKPKQG